MKKVNVLKAVVAGVFASTSLIALGDEAAKPAADKSAAMGQCQGVNGCKGQGACGGKGHSCAGKNTCKGKGWIETTKEECAAKKGKFVAAAAHK